MDPVSHGEALFRAYSADRTGRLWTYLPYGPFARMSDYFDWLARVCGDGDPQFYALVDARTRAAAGVAAYLRIMPDAGSIEIGHIALAPALQRSRAASEGLYLLIRRALSTLGYRRCEWKCDALNAASRRAALRLGFRFEGIFRQAAVYKGRNRDTAWYSIIDREWPALAGGFERWLDPANFDSDGMQKSSLSSMFALSAGAREAPAGHSDRRIEPQ